MKNRLTSILVSSVMLVGMGGTLAPMAHANVITNTNIDTQNSIVGGNGINVSNRAFNPQSAWGGNGWSNNGWGNNWNNGWGNNWNNNWRWNNCNVNHWGWNSWNHWGNNWNNCNGHNNNWGWNNNNNWRGW